MRRRSVQNSKVDFNGASPASAGEREQSVYVSLSTGLIVWWTKTTYKFPNGANCALFLLGALLVLSVSCCFANSFQDNCGKIYDRICVVRSIVCRAKYSKIETGSIFTGVLVKQLIIHLSSFLMFKTFCKSAENRFTETMFIMLSCSKGALTYVWLSVFWVMRSIWLTCLQIALSFLLGFQCKLTN